MRLLGAGLVLALLAPQDAPVVPVAENATLPSLALDSEGGAYAAFFRNGNIELAVSTDSGKTWSPPVTAMDAGKKAGGTYQRGPRVAVDKQKRVYVTAFGPLDPKVPSYTDLYLAVSTDRGKTFSKPVRLNDPPGTAAESLHASAVTPGGELHVAWLDNRRGKGQDVYYLKTSDPAVKKAPKNLLAGPLVCERCAPAIAVDAKGGAVIAYRDAGDPKKTRQVQFLSPPTGKPSQLNVVDTRLTRCPQDAPAIAVSADGKTVAAAWMDAREVNSDSNVFWTLQKDGKFPPETRANDLGNYYQGHPSIAIDDRGGAWYAWEDARHGVQRIYSAHSASRVNLSVTGEKDPKGAFPSVAAQGAWVAVAFELGPHVAFRTLAGP